MLFEVMGFAVGVLLIGTCWSLLMRRQRGRLVSSIYDRRTAAPRGGNALIWPSR